MIPVVLLRGVFCSVIHSINPHIISNPARSPPNGSEIARETPISRKKKSSFRVVFSRLVTTIQKAMQKSPIKKGSRICELPNNTLSG